MSKKNKKQNLNLTENEQEICLDIPEEEIWTYQIEGLAAPHIGKPYKHFALKKAIFIITIIVAVSLSIYFSVLMIANEDVFDYTSLSNGTYRLDKFSNTGEMTELYIDCHTTVEYDQISKEYVFKKDENKKVTEIKEYALNCDSQITTIYIGPDVTKIDNKAFYSCWMLERIEVDENNPNYCDIDGVLYNKDKTELINYPCNHDNYLRAKLGYEEEIYRADVTEQYKLDIQTYVVPSTVTKLGELCFAYTNLRDIYLPEGLERIETLAVFKLHEPKDQWGNTPSLERIYTYKTTSEISDTSYKAVSSFSKIYLSLPETLKYIGSDAFSYNRKFSYVYIPQSVEHIGHHAFWDNVTKDKVYKIDCPVCGNNEGFIEDDVLQCMHSCMGAEITEVKCFNCDKAISADTLKDSKKCPHCKKNIFINAPIGLTQIDIARSENDFEAVDSGDQWKPQYDHMLFKKSINAVYSSQRKPMP